MSLSQNYVDYMNGLISADEYRSGYPEAVRHLVKVPARRAIESHPLRVADLPTNPATCGIYLVHEGY